MKRIIKVLVVSALMVVLMATTVSPAFANHKDPRWAGHYGHGADGECKQEGCGFKTGHER